MNTEKKILSRVSQIQKDFANGNVIATEITKNHAAELLGKFRNSAETVLSNTQGCNLDIEFLNRVLRQASFELEIYIDLREQGKIKLNGTAAKEVQA